jgi:ActR/RegA family two-component response regulator
MVELAKNFGSPESRPWWNDCLSPQAPILAAEPNLADAKHLVQCFGRLRQPVRLAMSPTDIIDLLRREVFGRAIVATEMELEGEPMVARLARLPMLVRVVATGPSGDPALEVRARAAGAHIYLPRPVDVEDLARALAIPGFAKTRA